MANAPSPRRWAGGTLECFCRDYTGLRRDVRPAGAVFPVAVSPVRPSPSLQCHAGCCGDTPDAVGAHGGRTSPCRTLYLVRPPWTAPSSRPADNGRTTNLYTTTLEATPVRAQDAPRRPEWNKIRQDGRQLRGTARHASTRRRIVRHACKSLSPWPIKGRAIPQLQGNDR
jgi:hypothetical protein